MDTCPTCGRRPSERDRMLSHCGDPIHDLADEAPELKARVEELEAEVASVGPKEAAAATKLVVARGQREEARARVQELECKAARAKEWWSESAALKRLAEVERERDEALADVVALGEALEIRAGVTAKAEAERDKARAELAEAVTLLRDMRPYALGTPTSTRALAFLAKHAKKQDH